jgi:hypothetical protein
MGSGGNRRQPSQDEQAEEVDGHGVAGIVREEAADVLRDALGSMARS